MDLDEQQYLLDSGVRLGDLEPAMFIAYVQAQTMLSIARSLEQLVEQDFKDA